ATALAGEQFNRQLHRKESDWITANAAKYAAQHPGMSVEQAETVLAQQAYRQVQSGASGVWEAAASAFDQRKDSQMFGKQEQTDFYFNKKHGISGTTAEMSASWEGAREAEKKSAQQAAVLMTSSFLRPAVSIYAGVGSSTLLSVAAGRFGAGTIGAGANVSPRGHSDARSLQQRLTIK
ncbi:hypothetical protein, partial [Dyella sp.]|uniref:hypothetical protein n=1 Tax=Dyella sp. TaxID=1869338 RepID=UPI002ED0E2D0